MTTAAQYTVRLHDDGTTSCTCSAGQFSKPCWHAKCLRAAAAEDLARRDTADAERQYAIAGLEHVVNVYRMKRALHPADAVRLDRLIADAERDLAALAG